MAVKEVFKGIYWNAPYKKYGNSGQIASVVVKISKEKIVMDWGRIHSLSLIAVPHKMSSTETYDAKLLKTTDVETRTVGDGKNDL